MTDISGKAADRIFILAVMAAVALLYLLVFADMPLYGDAWGYGYNCAAWLSENGLPLVPSGTDRGETAGGHAAFYFWLWAVMMKIMGDSTATAHLLPAVFTFLAVIGTWKLGKDLGGRLLGILSGTALLVSPLTMAQAFRSLPIAAVMAASAWALHFYAVKKYGPASAAMIFAVMMREQAMVIPAACIIADLYPERGKTGGKTALLLLPFLVPVINGISNYLVNGYVFLEGNIPGIDEPFSLSLFLQRLKFFGFFLTGHYRWLPLALGIGFLYHRNGYSRAGLSLAAILSVFGALPRFRNYFTIILFASLSYLASRKKPAGIHVALTLVPFLMIMFFVLIKFLTSSIMEFTFFRYLMAAFPPLLVGMLWMLTSSGMKGTIPAIAFLVLTALGNFSVKYETNYMDTSLEGYRAPLLLMRTAGARAAAKDLPILVLSGASMHFANPALGYSDEPLEQISLDEFLANPDPGRYFLAVASWDESENVYRNVVLNVDRELEAVKDTVLSRGPFTVECIELIVD